MNSNGMDVQLTETRIQFRVVGGIVDLYVMAGEAKPGVLTPVLVAWQLMHAHDIQARCCSCRCL